MFSQRNDDWYCEQVSLSQVAGATGTPVYVYSQTAVESVYRAYDAALAPVPHQVCFAVKANTSQAVLRAVAALGGGADIVSGGELFRAVRAGIPADRIVYSGVGKTSDEIAAALDAGIRMFNVESEPELECIDAVARAKGKVAPVAVRVNPNVDPQTHPYIATGLQSSKFGIPFSRVEDVYRKAAQCSGVRVVGIACHIGSQLTSLEPIVAAARIVRDLVDRLRDQGHAIAWVDLGGGLGIRYQAEEPPDVAQWGQALAAVFADADVVVVVEPGRSLVGNAGVLLTEVLYVKEGAEKTFVVVDAAMNDLPRPSLYGAYHHIVPLRPRDGAVQAVDVVGPICESGDFLAKDRPLPPVAPGDLLAVFSAGAYASAMASTYNSRPLAPEVLVRGDAWAVVRRRGTYEDLVAAEQVAPWQAG